MYRERLIVYGCGDFIGDCEGTGGPEAFRADLGLMYCPTLDADSGRLPRFGLVPTQIKRLAVRLASAADARWLQALVDRDGDRFGSLTASTEDQRLKMRWRNMHDLRLPGP